MEKLNEKIHSIKSLEWLIDLIGNIGLSILQIIITSIIIKFLIRLTKRTFAVRSKLSERKKQTLCEVVESIIKYSIWFIAICSILTNFGVNIASLIAVAGVGSVAIGFGAQSLVQDIITGMFILFEDQFGVGDIITVDNLTGTVESIGIRSTRIRSVDGDLYIIPNGSIKTITNMSKEYNRAVVDIGIAYEENTDKVLKVMKEEMHNVYINKKIEGLISEPEVLGVIDLADSAVVIRILADTQIGENWHVEREIRRIMKNRFDRENIEIPYTKRVIEIVDERKEA